MALDLFSLKGRSALITGGSRGIGKMIAKGFIDSGAKVYISSRKAGDCDATAAELGPNCISLPQDVSTVDGVQALAACYQTHEDKLDILVNNAGAAWGAPFEEFPESGWDKVMNLNVKSPFFLTQALYG
ncbi:MAG: gno, partial [Phenylobacterium sp.]|nr:gno [Phenylobacterium sp.]